MLFLRQYECDCLNGFQILNDYIYTTSGFHQFNFLQEKTSDLRSSATDNDNKAKSLEINLLTLLKQNVIISITNYM